MTRIGLLSDTHAWLYPGLFDFFRNCDELWHAGDIGDLATYDVLRGFKPLRAVYGNIDGQEIRSICPEVEIFMCEGVKTMIRHIGGYPGRYDRNAREIIERERPSLFISGHSHILKIIYDEREKLLHMNPGAAGRYGLHQMITCIRFVIEGENIRDVEILQKEKAGIK